MFDASAYSVAVFGVPLGYHANKYNANELTDEEWAAEHGVPPEIPEEIR